MEIEVVSEDDVLINDDQEQIDADREYAEMLAAEDFQDEILTMKEQRNKIDEYRTQPERAQVQQQIEDDQKYCEMLVAEELRVEKAKAEAYKSTKIPIVTTTKTPAEWLSHMVDDSGYKDDVLATIAKLNREVLNSIHTLTDTSLRIKLWTIIWNDHITIHPVVKPPPNFTMYQLWYYMIESVPAALDELLDGLEAIFKKRPYVDDRTQDIVI